MNKFTENEYSIVLTNSGDLYAWGCNYCGQLGLGDHTNRDTPTKITSLEHVKFIVCGDNYAIAKTDKGSYGWGSNSLGQLGIGVKSDTKNTPHKITFPEDEETIVEWVSCGSHFVIAKTSNGLFSWGSNSYGELGLGYRDSHKDKPVKITFFDDNNLIVYNVSCGRFHSVAQTSSGIYVWGNNDSSQILPVDPKIKRHVYIPERLDLFIDVKNVTCVHFCTIFETSLGVYIMGYSNFYTKTLDITTPEKIKSLENAEWISCGSIQLIAKTPKGLIRIYRGNQGTPLDFFKNETVYWISTGQFSVLAKTSTGLFSWGVDSKGQLGCGARGNVGTPRKIELDDVVDSLDSRLSVFVGRYLYGSVRGKVAIKDNSDKLCKELSNLSWDIQKMILRRI